MSLKPTEKNTNFFGPALSAETWSKAAIGADKTAGEEGFENFKVGNWIWSAEYRLINKNSPENSSLEAVEEMADMRNSLVEEILSTARELDKMIMRLEKMENQMRAVMLEEEI